MQRPIALLILALLALPALAALAHAATISASNAAQLRYLIVHANTTYTIAAEGDKIAIKNTDVNHTLLLVFNPTMGISLINLSGAQPVVYNVTNNSIVYAFNGTSWSVIGYGGEGGSDTALALLITPNSTATIQQVVYEAPGEAEAEKLSAIAPPAGFKLEIDKYGTSSATWKWTAPQDGVLWVAFYQGDAADGNPNPSDLYIYTYTNDFPQLSLHLKKVMRGKVGGYETGTITVGAQEALDFQVVTYTNSFKTAWRVIIAYKPFQDKPNKPKQPVTTTTTHTPDARLPSSLDAKDAKLAAAAAAGFLLVLIIGMAAMGKRR